MTAPRNGTLFWLARYLDDDRLDRMQVLILVCLAEHVDVNDVCWPSQRTIARRARCHPGSVRRRLAELETMGVLERVERWEGDRQTSNEYRLLRSWLASEAPAHPDPPAHLSAGPPAHQCAGPPAHPSAPMNHPKEPPKDDDDTREVPSTSTDPDGGRSSSSFMSRVLEVFADAVIADAPATIRNPRAYRTQVIRTAERERAPDVFALRRRHPDWSAAAVARALVLGDTVTDAFVDVDRQPCPDCDGSGWVPVDASTVDACGTCDRRGWVAS